MASPSASSSDDASLVPHRDPAHAPAQNAPSYASAYSAEHVHLSNSPEPWHDLVDLFHDPASTFSSPTLNNLSDLSSASASSTSSTPLSAYYPSIDTPPSYKEDIASAYSFALTNSLAAGSVDSPSHAFASYISPSYSHPSLHDRPVVTLEPPPPGRKQALPPAIDQHAVFLMTASDYSSGPASASQWYPPQLPSTHSPQASESPLFYDAAQPPAPAPLGQAFTHTSDWSPSTITDSYPPTNVASQVLSVIHDDRNASHYQPFETISTYSSSTYPDYLRSDYLTSPVDPALTQRSPSSTLHISSSEPSASVHQPSAAPSASVPLTSSSSSSGRKRQRDDSPPRADEADLDDDDDKDGEYRPEGKRARRANAPASRRTAGRRSLPSPDPSTIHLADSHSPQPSSEPRLPLQSTSTDDVVVPIEPLPRKRGKLPKETTETLRTWLMANKGHPYPTEEEKKMLCSRTGLNMSQVSNWMINARRRILTPTNKLLHQSTQNPFPRGNPPTALSSSSRTVSSSSTSALSSAPSRTAVGSVKVVSIPTHGVPSASYSTSYPSSRRNVTSTPGILPSSAYDAPSPYQPRSVSDPPLYAQSPRNQPYAYPSSSEMNAHQLDLRRMQQQATSSQDSRYHTSSVSPQMSHGYAQPSQSHSQSQSQSRRMQYHPLAAGNGHGHASSGSSPFTSPTTSSFPQSHHSSSPPSYSSPSSSRAAQSYMNATSGGRGSISSATGRPPMSPEEFAAYGYSNPQATYVAEYAAAAARHSQPQSRHYEQQKQQHQYGSSSPSEEEDHHSRSQNASGY